MFYWVGRDQSTNDLKGKIAEFVKSMSTLVVRERRRSGLDPIDVTYLAVAVANSTGAMAGSSTRRL
jgi:hypothetical protein